MTLTAIVSMFGAMVALAIVPDASAFAVAARSVASGFKHGVVVIAGIVTGDLIFILVAVFGLTAITNTIDNFFIVIKYLSATFLICLGFMLWKAKPKEIELEGIKDMSWRSNFLCGLLITLGDPKAILFYLSFLPAFIDLGTASVNDVLILLIIAILALCCTKLPYAFMADKSRLLFKSSKAKRTINLIAASVMFVTAIYLLLKT